MYAVTVVSMTGKGNQRVKVKMMLDGTYWSARVIG
jgi:hypothetical protein